MLIGGSECVITSSTANQIICETGSYSFSSVKTLVKVSVENVGEAINTNAYFEYIDLWSSPFTWGGTSVPGEGELVVIQESQTIYFDAKTPILAGVLILGGSLIFDDMQDVSLQAQYIIITSNGKLQIGTEDNPFMHKAVITMYGSVRSTELPVYGSKVIALRNGTIDMHGAPVGVTWTHLGLTANQGDTTITLKESVTWPVNSQIIIATTGDHLSQGQSELRKITNVNGNQLTLDIPLNFTHLSVNRTVFDTFVLIRAEVGLLTRNILFQGKFRFRFFE